MKFSRNAISMIKSAYKSNNFRGVILGTASVCCYPVAAGAYENIEAESLSYTKNRDVELYLKFVSVSDLKVGSISEGGARVYIHKLKSDDIKIEAPWDQEPSILAVGEFGRKPGTTDIKFKENSNPRDYVPYATTSNISIGQNSAFVYAELYGIGEFGWGGHPGNWKWNYGEHLAGARACIKRAGGISKNGIKAMLYLTRPLTVGKDVGITVDGDAISPATEKNTLRIGPNSAVVLGKHRVKSAAKDLSTEPTRRVATISFGKSGTVSYTDSSMILLDSSDIKIGDRYGIFYNAKVVNSSGSGKPLKVESANGNFKTYIPHSDTTGYTPGIMKVDKPKNSNGGSGVTAPVVQTFTFSDYYNLSEPLYVLLQDSLSNPLAVGPGASYLAAVAGETFTGGSEIELAARHHVYGGAYQSSLAAVNFADNAIGKRIALDERSSRTTGLWMLPYFGHYIAEKLNSGRTEYGLNTTFSGLALGTDICIDDKYRVGLMTHFGNSKTDGTSIANKTKGKNRFWGFGVYASALEKRFIADAEVIYSHINSKTDSRLDLISYHSLNTAAKGDMLRAGVNTSLIYDFGDFRVLPYTGIKYTKLKFKDSDVYADRVKVAKIHSGSVDVVTVPLGVKLNIVRSLGDWSVLPEAKIGVNFNLGKTDARMKTTFIGAGSAELNAQVMNRFTYEAGIGLKLEHSSNLNLSLGASYVGSSATKLFNVALEGSYRF